MKKKGILGFLFLLLALFGAFVLLVWGRTIRALWYAMGSDATSVKQAATMKAAVDSVEADEKAKTPAKK